MASQIYLALAGHLKSVVGPLVGKHCLND